MRNFLIILKGEYRKRVMKRSFLLGVLGLPLLIIALIGVIVLVTVGGMSEKPLGYVDHSGLIQNQASPQQKTSSQIKIIPFANESEAQQALESKEIQAYYVIPADYLKTQQVDRYDWDKALGQPIQRDFADFLRLNLVSGQPQAVQTRLIEGANLTVRSMDGAREMDSSSALGFVIPVVAGFLFMFVVMSSAGYLMQVVTDEKENRTMEILVTSVSPEQLIGGKAAGLLAVALTQIGIWAAILIVGIFIGGKYWEPLQNVRIPLDFLLVIVLFFLPAFALVGGLMTAIGSMVSELSQGQQVAGLLNLLFILPVFFIAIVMTNPNNPLLVVLTLFPTTSFLTVSMRWGISAVPFWQLAAGWLITALSAGLSVWAAARIFRLGMLRYGQRLSLNSALAALRLR
ncbi:MAG: ABC transporter permease [Omnitrophica WOR_2 bacterium]